MAQRYIMLGLLPYLGWLIFYYDYHFLDNVNLALHEGGHIVLGFGGQTLHVLGGSLVQWLFPAAFVLKFYRDGNHFASALCSLWLAESLMYTARYLGDAKAQVLPLVGGHIHDWNWLLSRWGLLDHCQFLASMLHFLAAIGLMVAWYWGWKSMNLEHD